MRNRSRDSRTPEITAASSGVRQGSKPNGRDRKAGLVHASPARSASEGDAISLNLIIIMEYAP